MMRKMTVCVLGFLIASTVHGVPVPLPQSGVVALTDNIILNPGDMNGGTVESLGVTILSNGSVLTGWQDNQAVIGTCWLLVDSQGNRVAGPLAFAKPDGSPTGLNGGWGPKMHCNDWGPGVLFGSAFWDFDGTTQPENYMESLAFLGGVDSTPAVQMINNDGTFNGHIVLPYPTDFILREGAMRIGDAGILSNGNIVVFGEDRQAGDGPDLFGLPNADRVIIMGIVQPDGTIVKPPVAVQTTDARGEMWHGCAVFEGGFAARYTAGPVCLRFYSNDGTPTTNQIDLSTVDPLINQGGRGDSAGFHANPKGDCLIVNQTGGRCIAAVFNKNGTVKVPAFDVDTPDFQYGLGADRVDGAIDENGNFLAVWRDMSYPGVDFAPGTGLIACRFFNADGTPATPSFIVTSASTENWFTSEDRRPRASMRNGVAAIGWEDSNTNLLGVREMVLRLFRSPFQTPVQDWELH